jgi:hypothetical protein
VDGILARGTGGGKARACWSDIPARSSSLSVNNAASTTRCGQGRRASRCIIVHMDDHEGFGVVKLIIDGFVAFGTVAVAVLAIWGDWLRSKLAPLSLILVEHTPRGDPALFATGTRVMFYHLKVVNRRRWLPAQNCRVMLMGFSRRDPSGMFQPLSLSVPQQFVWAPAESTPPSITLLKEQVLDFGLI